MRWISKIALALAFSMTAITQADEEKTQNPANKTDKKSTDQEFIMEAASGGMMEVYLGKLASQSASNADVKRFGERMVTDHTKANKELMAIAQTKQVTIPKTFMKDHQSNIDKLKDLKGEEFDKAYVKCMLKDHRDDIEKFSQQAKNGQSEELRKFAEATLPTLKEHHNMIKEIAKKLDIKDDSSDSKTERK